MVSPSGGESGKPLCVERREGRPPFHVNNLVKTFCVNVLIFHILTLRAFSRSKIIDYNGNDKSLTQEIVHMYIAL